MENTKNCLDLRNLIILNNLIKYLGKTLPKDRFFSSFCPQSTKPTLFQPKLGQTPFLFHLWY